MLFPVFDIFLLLYHNVFLKSTNSLPFETEFFAPMHGVSCRMWNCSCIAPQRRCVLFVLRCDIDGI